MVNPRPSERGQRFWGKYRGMVLDNVDPLQRGRVMAEVPAISTMMLSWAMPCVPYAGPGVGMYFIPPIGGNVWIKFEGGDPGYPIWAGCFWGEGELPFEAGADSVDTKLIKTQFNTLILDDTPETGGVRVTSEPPAVQEPVTTVITSD